MSSTFFSSEQTIYNIKGPMGKGILLKTEGLHVAFAAGTGVLTFMDTVAFAARIALDKVLGQQAQMNKSRRQMTSLNHTEIGNLSESSFEFVLYVSFNSRAASIGLDLCNLLDEFCRKNNLNTFRLVKRISQEQTGSNRTRWDEAYIRAELGKLCGIQQVLVCGTPMISEIFDKTFAKLAQEHFNGLNSLKLHIL